jgi:hypothetical protein
MEWKPKNPEKIPIFINLQGLTTSSTFSPFLGFKLVEKKLKLLKKDIGLWTTLLPHSEILFTVAFFTLFGKFRSPVTSISSVC